VSVLSETGQARVGTRELAPSEHLGPPLGLGQGQQSPNLAFSQQASGYDVQQPNTL